MALLALSVLSAVTVAEANEQVYYFHNDHLGTPQAMSDATGRTVWTAEYEPFGKATANQDPDGDGQIVVNNLRFPGQYFDAETGLHYNWNRYYDPGTGRYLTPDPIGLAGGTNLYTYVRGNPINYVDPLGLYGTNDCSYYEQRCKEIGGDYYCKTAPHYCDEAFKKYPDPDPCRDDDYEGWTRCTRKCLQDCDAENAPGKTRQDLDDFWDSVHKDCHIKCYTECGKGKVTGKNPY